MSSGPEYRQIGGEWGPNPWGAVEEYFQFIYEYPQIADLFPKLEQGHTLPEWQRGSGRLESTADSLRLIGTSAVNKVERIVRALFAVEALADDSLIYFTASRGEENQAYPAGLISFEKAMEIIPQAGKGRLVFAQGTLEETESGFKLTPQKLDNAILTADSLLARAGRVGLVYTCDARYRLPATPQHPKGKIITKVGGGADLMEKAVRENLCGKDGEDKTIILESGGFFFSPELGACINFTVFDEMVLASLTKEEVDHIVGNASLYAGAPGGIDICSLIMRGKVKEVNGIGVAELEEKYGTSWRWWIDQASKGFHLGLVAFLGALEDKGPETQLATMDRSKMAQILKPNSAIFDYPMSGIEWLSSPQEFAWAGREVNYHEIPGNMDGGSWRRDFFERALAAMTADNYIARAKLVDPNRRYWQGENPADSKYQLFNSVTFPSLMAKLSS